MVQLSIQRIDRSAYYPGRIKIKQWIESTLEQILEQTLARYSSIPDPSLCVRIVSMTEIQNLNHQYRHKNKPTNVLSFPYQPLLPDPENTESYLGDIVLCAQIVEQEALTQKKTTEAHFAHMIIHSTLHLLGYDHEEPKAAEQMESYEVEILKIFNFPDPYQNNNRGGL